MSQKSKGSSCLAIFIKSWLISALFLGLSLLAVVALGVNFLDWNAAAWKEVSGLTSYPVIAAITLFGVSTLLAGGASILFGAAKMFLSNSGKDSKRSSVRRGPRPQSQRKTTV